MFSRRFQGNQTANRLTRTLQRKKEGSVPVLDLTESNPTRAGIVYDTAEIARGLSLPAGMLYEPSPRGLPAAREAISRYYRDRGIAVSPDSLVLSSGTSEAYGYLFKLLADPGDEVLVPVPGYPLLNVLTELDAVRLVPYRMLYDDAHGWSVDLERLRNTVSNRSVAIAVVSPNNPTGSFLKRGELAGMAELCRRFQLALIVDEVFSDYVAGEDPTRVASAVDHDAALTFCLNGFSKIVGLPQLKLAWTHVSGPAELRTQSLERLEYIADAYLSVGTPIQHAASIILQQRGAVQKQILDRLAENEQVLRAAISRVPSCRLLLREGGWYSVVQLPDEVSDEDLTVALLEEDDVLVHPGYFYDFPAGSHVVASLLTPPNAFRDGVEKLAARLKAGPRDDIVRGGPWRNE